MAKTLENNKPAWHRWLKVAGVVLWAAAVIAVAFSQAARRTQVIDYNSINGDFQSYNAFRRVLAGQAPYADFANYVGMAPIVLNLPFLLVDGSFATSLFATHFTSSLLFSLLVLAIFWLVTENAPASLLASAVFAKLVSSGLVTRVTGALFGDYFRLLFESLYTPSNSMRMARMFWPVLLVLGFLVFDRVWQRKKGDHYRLAEGPKHPAFCAVAGAIVGLGVSWSNDFGLGTAAAALLLFVLLLARQRPGAGVFVKRLCLFLGSFAAGAFLSIFAASGGHPTAWLRFTAGVGQYQYFYFNGAGGRALLPYIFTNGRLLLASLPYGVFFVFCLVRLIQGRLSTRLLLGGFLALSVLAASYAYVVSGSGYNFTEALEGLLWLALVAGVVAGLLWLLRRWKTQAALGLTAAVCAVAVLFGTVAVRDGVAGRAAPAVGSYVEALGGYSTYTRALVEAAAFTGDEPVFSLYATGLEVVKGQLQPSGYDYIIHALGGQAQAEYLASFLQGNWRYVQTPALPVEDWLSVENWYIYRHIAAGYRRVFKTEYSWIWEKAEVALPTANATLELVQNDGRWELRVTAETDADFIADVRIRYATAFTSPLGAVLSLGRRCTALQTPSPLYPGVGTGVYLPAQSDGWYIPVTVRGGVGSAVLGPCDAAWVSLEVYDATIQNVLPVLDAPQDETGL